MALSVTSLGSTISSTDATSHVLTLSRAIAPNALALCAVVQRDTAGGSPQPTLSGGGVTWEVVASYRPKTTASDRRMTVFRAMGASPSGTSLTASHGGTTIEACALVCDEWAGAETSGSNGANAIVQSKTGTVDVGGQSVETATLTSALEKAANAIWAVFTHTNSAGGATIGGGGTEIDDPAAVEFTNIPTGYAFNDNSISATWPGSDFVGSIAVEVRVQESIAKGGSITPVGTLSAVIPLLLSLAGSITPVGSLAYSYLKDLAGSITPTGSVSMTRFKSFLAALGTDTLSLIQRAADTLHLSSQSEDTLNLDPLEEDDR